MNAKHDLTTKIETAYRSDRKALVNRVKKSVRNGADAEDILQDVFLRILDNMDFLDTMANIPALVWRGILNRIIDLWRHNVVRQKAGEVDVAEETLEEIVSEIGFDPCDYAVRSELTGALYDAISALPPEQQAVIEAQAIDGISFAELSERTGLSINTLMTRKRLAVKKLAAALRAWIQD